MDHGTMDHGTMDYGTMGPPAKGLLKKAPGGGTGPTNSANCMEIL